MHISFTAHNSGKGTSSFGLVDYLDKENKAYETIENEEGKIVIQELENDHQFESFFDGKFSENNTNQNINIDEVVNNIDTNRGTQNLKQSNFYMINVAPKKTELKHMEKLANEELEKRGLVKGNKNELLNNVYEEQKDQLMKMQMKLYAKDLMTEYANNFDREIYVDEAKLPDRKEKKVLENETERNFNEYLKLQGIEIKQPGSQEKSNKWITTNKLTIIDEKGSSYIAEFNLGANQTSEIFVPKKMMQEQENGDYKLPENLYKEKELEALNKFTLVEIKANFINSSTLKNNQIVYNFENNDSRFEESLKMSFKDSDLIQREGKFFVSKHLLNEKEKSSISNAIINEHGEEREKIYKELATEKGFNMEKRKLTVDDLLWYGKVETQRTHKATDKYVKKNIETLKEIDFLNKNKILNKSKIQELESKLIKDDNNNVIKPGMKKTGLNYHVHLVVSRHDKTMQKAENKISLSPLANHKSGIMHNGADVGFNRDQFFQKAEEVFDEKFDYDREKEESYEAYKEGKKEREMLRSNVAGKAKGEVKSFLMKHTGINHIKQNISPVQSIKKQMGIANIPTKIPKTPLDLAYKVGKKIIDKGLGY